MGALAGVEFADGFFFDLSYTLACEMEFVSDLFECFFGYADTEEFAQDVCFTWCECSQGASDFGREGLIDKTPIRIRRIFIDHDIDQTVVLSFYEGRVYRDVSAGHLECFRDLVDRYIEHFGQFLCAGFAFVLLLEALVGFVDFVHGANLVEWETYDTALFSEGLKDRLADPPHGIGDELEATCFVEFLRCFDESEVSFVDEVRKG